MRRPARCRRGGAYVAVLGASMIVVVIGVSSVLLSRVERHRSDIADRTVAADAHVRSAVELALRAIRGDPLWRTHVPGGVWSEPIPFAGGLLSWSLVDELDGSLADDPAQPVRLHVRAEVGDTVRMASVLLEPPPPADGLNLLYNGDAENGKHGWDCLECELHSKGNTPARGNLHLRAEGRDTPAAGMYQDLRGAIRPGATYRLRAWVRSKDTPDRVRLEIRTTGTGSGARSFAGPYVAIDARWTEYTTTFAPTWSGGLVSASLHVSTEMANRGIDLDEVDLVEVREDSIRPVAGTWRREVAP